MSESKPNVYTVKQVQFMLQLRKKQMAELIAEGAIAVSDIAPSGSKEPELRITKEAIAAFILARAILRKAETDFGVHSLSGTTSARPQGEADAEGVDASKRPPP